jgi:hypothetical protein
MDDDGGCCFRFVRKVGSKFIYFNFILCVLDRTLQIIYYCITNFGEHQSLKSTCLTFLLIKPIVNIVMAFINLLFITENWDMSLKLKKMFFYVISAEFCYPFWVQWSIDNKFEVQEITGPKFTITNKVLNVLHMMFCSLPQVLIVCVYSSFLGKFIWIDLLSLIFSSFFIFWSIIYYVMCLTDCIDLDDYYISKED